MEELKSFRVKGKIGRIYVCCLFFDNSEVQVTGDVDQGPPNLRVNPERQLCKQLFGVLQEASMLVWGELSAECFRCFLWLHLTEQSITSSNKLASTCSYHCTHRAFIQD